MSITPIICFIFFVLTCIFQSSDASTILVDGASLWKSPNVYIGDSVVFEHKQHYKLYIFQSQKAFNLCNSSHATLLTKPNATSYTWHPWPVGFFYFTFNDGSLRACQASQKLAIKVSDSAPPPQEAAMSPDISPTEAPAPSSGEDASPSRTFSWPFQPASPGPSTGKGGSGMPFINSNPAVGINIPKSKLICHHRANVNLRRSTNGDDRNASHWGCFPPPLAAVRPTCY